MSISSSHGRVATPPSHPSAHDPLQGLPVDSIKARIHSHVRAIVGFHARYGTTGRRRGNIARPIRDYLESEVFGQSLAEMGEETHRSRSTIHASIQRGKQLVGDAVDRGFKKPAEPSAERPTRNPKW